MLKLGWKVQATLGQLRLYNPKGMSVCLNTLETLKSKVMIDHFVVRYFRKKIGNFIFVPLSMAKVH